MTNTIQSLSRLTFSLILFSIASLSHASTPFSGTPIAIPGTIEVEDYDLGGAGDAYFDTSPGNTGGAYRSDDVDIESSATVTNVGWTAFGEWMKYTVNVASNGSYTMTARVASAVASGAFHIEVDDVDVTDMIGVGSTGGWQTWIDVSTNITLSAGQQVIKLVIDGPDLNIDRLDIAYNGPPPAAPTGLQVDATGANSVDLSWTAPVTGSPTGYNVKRAATSNGTYTVVGTTTAPVVAFNDTVTGGSTYYYVVSALTAGGESADSSVVSATPALGVPGAPTGLAATGGDNQVSLNWTVPTVGAPTSYNVKRSTTSGSGYVDITVPGAQTSTSYTDTTAVNGTTYYYVVSAVNGVGEGVVSGQEDATPAVYSGVYEPFDYPVGNIPNGTTASGDGVGSWTCGTDGIIYAGLTYPDLPIDHNALQSAGDRKFVSLDDPISSGTKWISFLYYVPGNMGGNHNGIYFPNSNADCLFFGFGLQPLSGSQGGLALGSISTAGTGAQAASLLTLLGAHDYGVTYLVAMEIQFDTSGANDTVTVYINPLPNQSTPGVAAAGTVNSFDVGTIMGVGLNVQAGGWVGLDEIRISDSYAGAVDAVVTPPSAPTGLIATAGTNHVYLSWTDAGGGLPVSYNVKRSSTSNGTYAVIGSTTVPTTTYNDEVIGGQTYYYAVSAVNGIGESANSEYASVTPILAAPEIPSGLSAVAGDSQVSLSWSASAFAISYTVKRADDVAGPYTTLGTTAALTYDDSGLNNAQTYYYVLAATGTGGSSVDSAPVNATPFGPVPLVAEIEQGVGITWFASNSVTYHVQWASEDFGTNTVWNNLGESISGAGETNTVFDTAGIPGNIYRILSIQ